MTATPYVGVDLVAVPPIATRWLNATPVSLGNGTGGPSVAYNTGRAHNNHFLRWDGAQFLVSGDGVYRAVDDGRTWVQVLAFGGATYAEGIFISHSFGVPKLSVLAWTAGVLTGYASLTGLSGSWSTTTAPAFCTQGANGKALVLGESVYGCVQDNAGTPYVAAFNPFTPAFTVTSSFPPGWTNGEYFVLWDGVVYGVGRLTGTGVGQLGITKFLAGAATLHTMIVSVGAPDYCSGLFHVAAWVNPTTNNLIVLARSNAAGAWHAFEVTPGLVVTNRTTTMIGSGAFSSFGASTKIAGVLFDTDSFIGADPTIYLLAANGDLSGTLISMFADNGVLLLLGDGLGNPNDVGGDIRIGVVNQNVGGERFFTARIPNVPGTPEVRFTGRGALLIANTRRKLKAEYPRSQVLVTLVGAAAYNLATTPLSSTPIQPGSVTIRGTVGAVALVAQDNGVGVFPVSPLLPAGGTVVYASGVMTGTTAVLDAASVVEALYNGGTASFRVYRAAAVVEYPVASPPAALSAPSHGTISGGNQNDGVPADGTEVQVTVSMSGFLAGDHFNLQPYVQ